MNATAATLRSRIFRTDRTEWRSFDQTACRGGYQARLAAQKAPAAPQIAAERHKRAGRR